MPRNISFAKTIPQIKAETKTETRRLGWDFVREGDLLRAVDKTMGFKKGEKPELLSLIVVSKTWREPLNAITPAGVVAEGFPEMTPAEFVAFFCEVNKCAPDINVRVIQFDYFPF